MDEMLEILKNLDWSPLFISIKTGIVATIFSFFLGIYAARKVVKTTPGKKAIIDGILTLPMVLPPTVAGFFLLLIFSRRRPFGIFLFEQFGIKVVQTWLGCIIAATVISFPLMYRNARAAMEQIDVNLIYAGRTLGMSDTEIFWKVVIPTAVRESHPEQFLHLPEHSENMERHLCLQEIFRERQEQSRRRSQWSFRTETI